MKKSICRRAIYFALNSIALFLAFIGSFSLSDTVVCLIYLGIFLLTELILFFLFVKPRRHDSPAARDIPLLLFFDIIAYTGAALTGFFLDSPYASRFTYEITISDGSVLSVIFLAVVLGIVGLSTKKRTPKWLSALILGLGGIAGLGGTYFFQFVLYAAFVCVWMGACIAAERIDGKTAARDNWLGTALAVLFMAALLFGKDLLVLYLEPGWYRILELSRTVLSTPWAAFAVAVGLALCALPMCSFDPWRVEIDAYLLLTFASLLLVGSFTLQRPIAYAFLVLAVVFVLAFRRMARYASGQSAGPYYPLKLAALGILIIHTTYDGLWLTLLILGVSALFFRILRKKNPLYRERPLYWTLLIISGFLLSMSILYYKRRSAEGALVLLLITAVTLAALWVLSRPHPAGIGVGSLHRIVICSLFAVLCAVTLCRGGVAVTPQFDGSYIHAHISARGRDAYIESATYQWVDSIGSEEGTEYTCSAGVSAFTAHLGITNTRVVIRATDSNGVFTRTILWTPVDLDQILYS